MADGSGHRPRRAVQPGPVADHEPPRPVDPAPGRQLGAAGGAEVDVEIDLTDATVAQHGGPIITLRDRVTRSDGPLAALMASPLALLVTVNALNVVDAALTILWIEMGIALEANPIVDAVGFPAKVFAVGIGSYLVYRVRPRWLIVPIAALAAVCVYHVVGAAVVLAGAA